MIARRLFTVYLFPIWAVVQSISLWLGLLLMVLGWSGSRVFCFYRWLWSCRSVCMNHPANIAVAVAGGDDFRLVCKVHLRCFFTVDVFITSFAIVYPWTAPFMILTFLWSSGFYWSWTSILTQANIAVHLGRSLHHSKRMLTSAIIEGA